MSGGHVHAAFAHGGGPLHQLAPQAKIAALVLFVLAVATTPTAAIAAYAAHAVLVIGLIAVAGLRPGHVLRRMAIELPFVAFALFLPFVGQGDRTDVFGLSLSVDGLWGAWNILAKATLGVAAAIVLASTTSVAELLHGLERLRLPRVFTAVAGFMVRYLDVATGEVQRMSVARRSRGHDPRWLWQARAVAATAGTLFIRSYERGERVHLAMVSRGYDGAMPVLADQEASRTEWLACLALPALAALVSAAAWAGLR